MLRNIPFDTEFPVGDILFSDLGDGAMIANIEELWSGQESFIKQGRQRRLDIERMNTGEAYESRIPRNVLVGSLCINIQDFGRTLGRRRQGNIGFFFRTFMIREAVICLRWRRREIVLHQSL